MAMMLVWYGLALIAATAAVMLVSRYIDRRLKKLSDLTSFSAAPEASAAVPDDMSGYDLDFDQVRDGEVVHCVTLTSRRYRFRAVNSAAGLYELTSSGDKRFRKGRQETYLVGSYKDGEMILRKFVHGGLLRLYVNGQDGRGAILLQTEALFRVFKEVGEEAAAGGVKRG